MSFWKAFTGVQWSSPQPALAGTGHLRPGLGAGRQLLHVPQLLHDLHRPSRAARSRRGARRGCRASARATPPRSRRSPPTTTTEATPTSRAARPRRMPTCPHVAAPHRRRAGADAGRAPCWSRCSASQALERPRPDPRALTGPSALPGRGDLRHFGRAQPWLFQGMGVAASHRRRLVSRCCSSRTARAACARPEKARFFGVLIVVYDIYVDEAYHALVVRRAVPRLLPVLVRPAHPRLDRRTLGWLAHFIAAIDDAIGSCASSTAQ